VRRAESTPVNMVSSVIVTCVVASAALAGTYQLTNERIVAQQKAAEEAAIQAVLEAAEETEPLDEQTVQRAAEAAEEGGVSAIYSAVDASGDPVGWAVRVAPRGYGGPMQMVVGVDRSGLVTGVSIITQNETPGLGTKILTEPGFLEQFEGWDGAAVDEAARSFDAISGATKSSNGVRKGVLAAGHVYADVLSGEGGSSDE